MIDTDKIHLGDKYVAAICRGSSVYRVCTVTHVLTVKGGAAEGRDLTLICFNNETSFRTEEALREDGIFLSKDEYKESLRTEDIPESAVAEWVPL